MIKVKLSPMMKAVIATVVAAVTLVAQCVVNGVIDDASLITLIGGVSTVFGVYRATNKPAPVDEGDILGSGA